MQHTLVPLLLLLGSQGEVGSAAQSLSEAFKLPIPGIATDSFFGSSAAIGPGFCVIGAPGDADFGVDSGAIFVVSLPLDHSNTESVKLYPSDVGPFLGFGNVVSVSGHRIAVTTSIKKRTYLFYLTNAGWIEEAVIPYGGLSVSLSDDRLAIGVLGPSVGSVLIYRLDATTGVWVEDSSIFGSEIGDSFGRKVALDGNQLLIGAPNGIVDGSKTGVAYIFEHTVDGAWIETARLEPARATTGASFGLSLSLGLDMALVGAPRDNPTGAGSGKGSAYVYRRNAQNGVWASEGRLAVRGNADDSFGYAVAIGKQGIFVSAAFAEVDGLKSAGAVYHYRPRRVPGGTIAWNLVSKIHAGDVHENGVFGSALSQDKGLLLVGAIGTDSGGAAYSLGFP